MREHASRFTGLTCRLPAARFIVSICCLFIAASAASAATDFSDYSGFGSASSTVVSTIKIGTTTDSETSITANTTATGDDITGSDDEDGVTVPASVVAGTSGSLTVKVTNSSGATVFLNAWIDYNRNGVLTDSGEQIASNTTIATGTSNASKTITFTVPAAASIGTAGVRVRLTSTSSPGSTGQSGNGEVEDYIVSIVCPTITVTTSALDDGVVGRPYSQTLAASGGNGSYTWALASGTLPSGLTLNASTGVISGTPTSANGGASLTFTATDASGCQGSTTQTIQVWNYRFITPTSLPPPTVGTAYSQTMSARESGFDVQQAFSSTSVGTLAAADAVLAGTNRTSNWTGSASVISFSSSGAGGGHFTDSDFPAGPGDNFALKATGIITIPTAGAWTFATSSDDGARVKIDGTAVINDDTQHAVTDKFGTVNLTAGTHTIELVFFELGGGEAIELFAAAGTLSSFSSSFKLVGASDGLSVVRSSPSYTWAVASGSLPAGLTINSGTGVLSGTPTSASVANFTLRATDNSGFSVTQDYSVTTCSAITLSPSSLPAPMVYSAYSQSLSATGGMQPYGFALTSGSLPAGLSLNTDTGLISGRPTSTAAATFTIAATDANGCSSSRSYTLTPASPTDFGDYAALPSAASTVVSTLRIGALTDAEPSAVTDSSATGDDLSDLADEDGVTVPAYLIQGVSNSITVNVTNTTGATAYLNAWIDYNKNGVLTDSGEQIATNTTIATGTSNINKTLTFTVPATAATGTVGVRVRLTSTSSPGSTGASGNGEVEDNLVSILPPTDFGDDSGLAIAGSTSSTSIRMGALVDSEVSTLANAAATGDDTNGSDDEDGVTLPASVIQGQSGVSISVNLTNSSGADAFLNGWIDFNNNGLLTDAGEQIVVNDVVSTGTSGATRTYTFTVPGAAATGAIGVRFRLSSTASPGDSGISGTGEVEDYALTVVPASDHGDFSRFADASSYNTSALGIGDLEDTEITPVTNLAATGDDITNVNDEDGVTLQAILVQGQAGVAVTVKLNNTTGAPAYLNGWVDFNNNGTLDASEQVIADAVVDDGTSGDFQTFYFDVPSTATIGTAGARFRLTSVASPGPTGASGYGEVEDYTSSIVAPSSNFRDYFYTIRAVGTHFYLDEISVYNPNSSTPTVSVTQGILDLNTASPGFNTGATDAWMNGLALDWLNRRFYWLATSTGSNGYNASLYTANYNNVTKTWSYQLVTGSALSNVSFSSGTPSSATASSGAFPRAAFYNGEYYAGGQLSNNVAVWHLNAAGTGMASPAYNDYTNFFHLSQTFNGGDFVIRPQDGLLVTSTVISNANTLFNQFISDGTNSSGPSATTASVDAQIPYSSNSSVQIAGVGGVSRLYALGSSGSNIYRIDRYDTSSPNAVKVGPLPSASYTDLSEGISSSVTSLGVKGIVYYDTNGLSDGIISGTGTNASGRLYAMLVDSSGNLVDSFPVKSDGTFILGGATANTSYKVVLSTSYGSLGSAAPTSALPTGWLNAGEFLGSGAGSDGTIDGSLAVTVGSVGVVNATFGLSQTLSIGDTVWNDVNNNGLQDSGESGIGGVTVQLWTPGTDNAIGGTGGAADALAATTTTDGTGAYSFAGLVAGKYFVTVTPPTVYSVVSSTAAGDNGVDGDNNGSQPGGRATTVYSPIVTLTQVAEPGNLASGGGNVEDTIDFGLLTAVDYGDYASFGSAGSSLVANLYLGSLIDSEYSPLTNSSANGDDLNGLADEDGTIVPASIYVGTSGSLTITTTNTSGASAFLHVWIDFNRNGVLTDSGEQIASNVIIPNGTSKANRTVNYTVPGTASLGAAGVRVRLTSVSTPGSTGTTGNGEVEDYVTTIACPSITVPTPSPSTVGASYSQTLSAGGGTAPYTWALTSGTLPLGLTFNSSTAVISGTPLATNGSGTTVTFRVTDANGCQATLPLNILVCPVISVSTTTLPAAIQGAPYSQSLASSSGVAPYSYSVTSGSLPAGLTLATTGVFSGTSTSTGTSTFTVQTTDAYGCSGTRSLSITTNPPVTDFGDYPAFASASLTASTEIRIGTNATDVEPVNPATGSANADDTTGTDDEDLVIPSVVSGGELKFDFPVTLSGGTTLGRVAVWADWNGDGDTLDANESVTVTGSGVIGGSNTVTATFSPPAGTTVGTKYLRIIAIEGTTAPSFSGASTSKGEVEDYAISVTAPTLDYGDLPDTIIGTSAGNYQTLSNDNGPAHTANSNLRLGAAVDAEGNGQPNSTATGDGADDDGVAALPTLTQNVPATLTVTATNTFGSAGFLKAWIDWNNDGNLSADEELGSEISVPNGTSGGSFNFNFTVPSTAVIGANLGLRVRLASQTIPASNGVVGTGEVEDYLITVNVSTVDFGDNPGFPSASRVASTAIKIGTNATDVDNSNPISGNATVDDTTGTDDEDLTMPTLLAGSSGTLTIPVTLASPVTSGKIAVWADWNGDNAVTGTNEIVSLSTSSLVTGTNTITATLSPPSGITAGTKFLRIIATEGSTAPSFSGSSTLRGEVEDYAITVNTFVLDFGDLPDTGAGTSTGNYQTLSSDSGPSHTATSTTLRLGATIDTEADGQPNSTATGDGSDEDGITAMPVFYRGQNYTIPVSVFNNTGSTARIFAFIDWNNDGDFADSGETLSAVAVSSSSSPQTVNITGATPGTATLGTFGARFRLATASTLASTGTTADGEVEDYIVTGACPIIAITPASLPATAQYASYSQTLTAASGTAPYTWTITTGAIPGGLTLSSAGLLSGTVNSASGAYVFTVKATDANGCSATQSYTISVGSGGMSVGNLVFFDENNNGLKDATERGIPNVPVEIWSAGADGKVNSADDQPVTSGSASTLSSGGMLAAGSYGSIASGYSTLTAVTDWTGAYQFTSLPTGVFYLKITPPNKTVFSSKYGSGSTTYSLNLDFPLASSTSVLVDNGIDNDSNGVQTTGSFTGSGDAVVAGVGAAVFSMPFTLATATEPGTSNLGSDEYTIDFGLRPCPALGITPLTVPAVSSGVAYSTTLSTSGGTGPYTYAITQGALPSGLSMSTAGVISGTTSTTGTSAITIRATDARGCQGFTTIQLSVTTAMSITTASLPNGTEGTAYTSTTLAATGGTSPYQNWRVSTGSLPAGLSISSSTGVLSGTPTSPGTYVFTVAVDDALVTPASVTVTNGSVETDAWSAVTFTPRTSVTGWTLGSSALTGTTTAVQLYGVNNSNANNSQLGDTPAGSQYLASPFVDSWASQTVSGFTVGRPYTLRLRYAMRGAFTNPSTTEAQPPFYGNSLWIAGYNGSAASLFGPANVNFPAPASANYDNWATLDIPFVPQTSSIVFSYGLDGAAIDDIQFIPTVASTTTATRQFTVVIAGNRDWGDLPDTGIGTGTANYQTTSSDSGPSHYRDTNLRLGATLDIESDGQPDSTATGDDNTGTDDEDGISSLPVFARGKSFTIPVSVFNNTGGSANVFVFLDWNNDGDFLDPSEAVSSVSVSSSSSQQSVNVTGTVPGSAVLAQIGLRVRLSTASSLGAFGIATNGEVEDYLVNTTCPTLSLSPASLANGTLSLSYSQTVAATGGTAPYTYSLSSGTLPSGVTLNASSGVLSGTPNVAGTYTFTLGATDANGCSATQAFSVVMSCPTLSISPASLADGTVGTAYSQTLTASGGASPYASWTVTSGTLPAGLTLSSSGVISGTPTAGNGAGVTFTVRTTDANGCQGSQAITLQICPVVTLSPTTLATATVNSAYSQTITSSGGASPYTYTVSSGTLPAGLTLSSAGVLSGTPTSTTSRTFTITATDANGCPGSRSYTLAPACPLIAVTPATATRATVGVAYSQTLAASGGLAPYGSWTVTSGTLPAGLSLNASTGVISGTATTANGSGATVTFRTTDANGCTGSQAVVLQVCPVISISPSTLPNGTINSSYSQTLTSSGGASPYTYALTSGTLPAGITLTSAGLLSGTPTSTSAASFTVTATDANGCSASLPCTITPAPDSDFGDFSLFTNASSRMNATLRIGSLTDVEASATTNAAATGDDTTGSDDEDGVTLPASFTQGAAGSFTVNVTNTSGATAYLNAWIDYNQNGLLTDSGEQVAINTVIPTGTSNANKTISFTAPAAALLGSSGVRVRLTSTASPGPTGATGNGEVEDNVATFVAPTTDYGDFSLFADAYSTGNSNLRLGSLIDLEGSATKDSSAQGDDNTGSDDEDGITFPSMTAGQPMSLPVTVTNLTGSTAYLNAWIDYNNNGVLTDAGEQIASNVNVATGTNGGTLTLNFTVPTNAVTAASLIGTRFRLTNVATPGSTGGVGIGEVEDHAVVILAPLTDFGDFSGAPSVSNTASTNLRLGALVDTEYAATTNATATGDDVTGVDDEDGVTLPSMTAGAPVTIPVVATNTSGAPAYLNAWIDFNNNGVFTDSGEQIATNTNVATGVTNASFNISTTVPAAAVTGTGVGVRVRVSNDISPGSSGAGGVGEVEDYIVTIAAPTTDFGDFNGFATVSGTANSRLRLGALVDTEYVATTDATATGDNITGSDDEDGVTFAPMIAGASANISAVVTNTTGSTAYVNAWIDYNGNGSLTDAGEQIAANIAIATGTSGSAIGGAIPIPATALTGVPLGARVMITSASSPPLSGNVGTGEIEDYVITITAPTTDFGDFSGFADASQGVSPTLQMGGSVDAEYVSTRNTTATGDDTTGSDDEDGVTLPSMTAGQSLTIPVVITNSSGALGYLNAWIDFNNNGSLTDSGEQIASNLNIPTGSDGATFNINVTVPLSAVTGTGLGARFRLSAPTSPGPTGSNPAIGEIEDYVVTIAAPTIDFGDFSGFDSAGSTANSRLKIGSLVDAEYASNMNTTATGDDTTGSDDEDGVTIPTLTAGSLATISAKVTNSSGSSAYLNAWVDYNNNGSLTDSGEQIATNTVIVTGTSNVTKNISFTVPVGAVAGTPVGVRVRLTSISSPGSTGTSSGIGEVEDNVVTIVGPTTDYGDWSGIADASNTVVSTLRLGALTDAEFSSTKNATATGDDTTYLDDEDGIALPALTAGGTFTIPATVTNTSGASAYLNAWIDFNNNGSFADAGEQFASNVTVATGLTNSTLNLSIAVPPAAVTGTNLGARFRLTSASSPGSTGTGGGNGEVEDYVANIAAPTTDFGDFSGFAAASSIANTTLRLGTLVDKEYAATSSTDATGDDTTGSDDEDGVTLPSMTAGAPATIPVVVTNTTGSAAFLNMWIDYNNDGDLSGANEQVATNVSIATGTTGSTQNLSITVPAGAVTGTSLGVRTRLTSVSSPGPVGAAGTGEVEDYVVSIITPPLDYGDWSGIADAASNATTALRLGSLVDTEYVSTRNAAATGDDTTGSADEDGVTLPSMTAGAPATIPVVVTNTSGSTAYLNIWIDYNNNGVLTDAGEQIASNVIVASGTTSTTKNIGITVPAGAVTGSNVGVRVRLTDVASPGITGTAGNGEVEDYVTSIAVPTTDFGDWDGAPDASSLASSNLRMGALADTEYISTLNATATGDDTTGSDDEDGVTIGSQTPGTAGSASVVVTNNSGAPGYLNAWIDFNNNGSFADAGEQIAASTVIATGTNGVPQTVNFVVPVNAVPGQRGARFRLTSTQTPTSVGASGMGEVEDCLVTITCLPIALSPTTLSTPTVGTAYSQSVTSSGGMAPYTYAVSAGTLPAGLSLSSTGTLSGTPTSSSAATFSIKATDAYGCTGTQSYTVTPVCPAITVTPSTLPGGLVGTAYSQTLGASGGTAPYTFSLTSGTLPAGLTLNTTSGISAGLISGTPTTSNGAGVSLTFRATDANGCTGTRTITLIICPAITLTPATLPAPTVGTAYSQTLAGSGGAAPYTFALASGSLPSWATLSSSGVLSGTPTSTTAATFSVRATDANGCSGTLSYTVTPVCPAITVSPASLTQGVIGASYSQTLSASGGTAPYSAWTLTSGTLPAGLSLNASTGVISGTPTATASPATTLTFRVNDANGCQGTRSVTLQICPVITLSPTTLPAPVIGSAYSQSLGVSGGASPYSFSLASGSLPAWASLSTAGVITGTPTSGTPATFTVRATDANGCSSTMSCTLAPNCPVITLAPTIATQGIVGSAYSQTLTPSGGTAPYSSFTITSGTLPAGLSLNSSTGVISGTPTTSNGTGVSVSIRANDANGCQGTQAITFQICPVITISPATPSVPVVSTAWSQTFTAAGGAAPYTYSVSSGTLPTWATLTSAGVLSGTPDSPNSATFTLKATDANGCSATQSCTITPACPAMAISPLTAATGTVGAIYSQTLTGSGGTGPYGSWTVTSGTLPAGLSLSSSGVISGTPTASTGPATTVTVRTTDARGCQVSATISLKVCPVVALSPTTLATSTAGTSYSQTLTASGGVSPYVFTVSTGTLPAGLSLSSSGVFSGTPTSTASATFIVTATDANGCPGSRTYSMTPACPTITVSPASLPNGTVNSAYSQTVTSSGGVGAVTFAVSSGSLPAGLSLNSTSGVISGTPTSTAATTFTIRATDSNNCTGSTTFTITPACPVITVGPSTLATGAVGVAYSQTLSGSGGIAPYTTWTVTSGTLPAGLTLNPSSGVISGTPTTSNGTGVSVTIRTTDANGCQGSSVVSIKICPVITQSPASPAAPVIGVAYSQTITASGGVSPYTFTLASGSLPSGLSLSSSGTLSGTTTSSATATFSLKATAADGCSGTASYTLTPVCPTLSLSPTTTLPVAYLGASYTQILTASGGTAPYTFALQSGDLPGGVLLSTSGTLNGTPTAKGSFPVSVRVTDANACAQNFNLTLQVHTLSIGNLVFEDTNNNGLKDSGEPGVANATVQLFATGDDNAIGGSGTAADTQMGADFTTDSTGAYLFSLLPAGNYYVKVTPPADYLFTGGTATTSDNNVDNNNDGAQPGGSGTPLFSPVITLSGGAESTTDGDTDPDTNLTVDFGLWSSVAVGNFIFLDINGDGVRNEGESLGSIYVELYAQGATPGVDDPVSAGTSGCSCKGRYYLDGLNPGTYFLHIPASQFTTGSPLEGLLPMSSVVAGDDDVGQDLIFNNNPAVNGASTGLFTLRPGFCPVGAAESGAEGSVDDAIDARVDLTRDLGVVAPAGTGFAASEAIRRYIVTGGFTASVLPGASTFATWSQGSDIGGATDDPDEDGIPNLLEYALGTDPASPLQANRFSLAFHGSLVALLTQPTATHDDLTISIETLTDLTKAADASAWKKLTMASSTTINADGTLTRSYSNLENLLVFKGLDAGYIRLHVDLDANRDGVPEATVTSAVQGWGRQTFATGSRTFSMPLLNAAFFTGRAVSASANEIMLPAIVALPAGSLYLEALDGPLAGQRFDIDSAASSGNTIVLQNTTQSYAGLVNAHVAIRLHHTLAQLLPPAAFTADDRVLFFDSAAGSYTTLTHDSSGWLSDVLSMNARPVAAHEAALVQIRGAGTVLMFTGEVRLTNFVTPLVSGTQLVAPGWPVATAAPVTGLTSGLSPETADRFRLWDGDTTPEATSYTGYYLDGTTTPATWLPQTTPAPAATIQPFHGYFLIRTAPLQLNQTAPW
ncbi:beta strand repeat-containing protein [Prosthecobacter sp.]|uniref:beta strand repeat-containing protein n=1 Tax=Prosthecobacter sp. TaxID=1965333 RepID=UPI0037844991